jgi:suppressor of fused
MSTAAEDAIEAVLTKVYPQGEVSGFKTVRSYAEGGPDPLDLVRVFKVDAPAPHWHYVGIGLSELGDKMSDDEKRSGWGLELTFRLARTATEDAPPVWPVVMMQKLARYVNNERRPFGQAHYIAMGGPIASGQETALVGLTFSIDPTLGSLDGPNGRFDFIQVIGITQDELDLIDDDNVEGMLEALADATTPVYIVNLARTSLAALDKLRMAMKRGDEDGDG